MPGYEVVGTPPNHTLRPLNLFEVKADLTIDTTKPLILKDTGQSVAPDPPTIHSSSASTAPTTMLTRTSAQVNWDAPISGATVVGYEVWRDNALVTAINDPATLTYTETGLPTATPERIFTYAVRSVGATSYSGFSADVILQWNAVQPQVPEAPLTFTRSNLTDTSVTWSWTENTETGITKHTLHYGDGTIAQDNIGANILTATVSNLSPATTYTMYVTRSNSVGESGPSPTKTFTTDPSGGGGGTLIPGQIDSRVVMGMATDNYSARVTEVGKNGADHAYVGSWNPTEFISQVKTANGRGVLPFVSMKTGDWGNAAAGSLDADTLQLAKDLKALGYPIAMSFHHEPSNNNSQSRNATDNAEGGTLAEWRNMLIRLGKIILANADNVAFGPIDNGYKWSATSQGWTDAGLDTVYTQALYDACNFMGADCYEGSKKLADGSTQWGENASVKAQRLLNYHTARGWTGPIVLGEWNFVRPASCAAMWDVLSASPKRFMCAIAFNSDLQNRTDIPDPPGHWNFTHDYAATDDRLKAYKAAVADPIAYP